MAVEERWYEQQSCRLRHPPDASWMAIAVPVHYFRRAE